MLIRITSAKCIGINAVPIIVEVDIHPGLGIHMVGLADIAVKESLLRTMTALQSIGFRIPGKKIVINLAPANMHKTGSGFDVPIALGIMAASGQIELPDMSRYLIMGELGLDASVRPVKGSLPMTEMAIGKQMKACILPEESAREAAECYDFPIYGVRTLTDVLLILTEKQALQKNVEPSYTLFHGLQIKTIPAFQLPDDILDFSEIIGQEKAKRGLEIAASGNHNVILVGSQGIGKSSLAKALAGILPPMNREEAIQTRKIYSVAGKKTDSGSLIYQRPFRAPHYSISMAALFGGGTGENLMPGEISLANNGVLFLDEYTQIPRALTEALRAPLEDRKVTISRLRSKVEYPASFMLVAAANPCPCGHYGDGDKCTCSVAQRSAYLSKLSGPIMDRIDLQIFMKPVEAKKLVHPEKSESSREIAQRVRDARKIQQERFKGLDIRTNAEMNNNQLEKFCPLSDECRQLLERMIGNMGLSPRAFTRIIKLSRTIADLDHVSAIQTRHLLEAASFRFLDKNQL